MYFSYFCTNQFSVDIGIDFVEAQKVDNTTRVCILNPHYK